MDETGQLSAARRLPEGLVGIRALHELIAAHAEEPDQVMIGVASTKVVYEFGPVDEVRRVVAE